MGASTTKHTTPASDGGSAVYARRKSVRNSLRSTKGSTKDIFSSTDKYLQSLNDDFEKGVICHKKLEELRKIEDEVNTILRDLQDFGKIDNSSSKLFKLENTAKYLRNKLKSSMDTHMGSAIKKLNNTSTENCEPSIITAPNVSNVQQENKVQVISETEQVAAKLRETSIKLRELLGLITSMYVIDQITEDSAIRMLNNCKGDLYHMQPKTEKHLLKRNKCFRTIDDIRTILLKRKLGNLGISGTSPGESNKIDSNESLNYESDACGVDGDKEDNDEADEKEVLHHNKNVPAKKDSHNVDLNESNIIDGNANIDRQAVLKTTMKNIRSCFLSLNEMDLPESTKKSLQERFENAEKQLRSFKPVSSTEQKRKTRYLKEIEEMKIILQKKYSDSSDEDGSDLIIINHAIIENEDGASNTSMLHQQSRNNENKNLTVESKHIISGDNNKTQSIAMQTDLMLTTEKLYETFNRTINMIFHISKTGSNASVDLNTVKRNITDIDRHFIALINLVSNKKENTISNNYLRESQAKPADIDVIEMHSDLPTSGYNYNEIQITGSSTEKNNNVLVVRVQDEEIKSNIYRGRSSPDLFTVDEKFSRTGKEVKYIRAASSMLEYSNNDSLPTIKEFRQSSSVDELERVTKTHMHETLSTNRDLYNMLQSSKIQLVSMRNIDLSQLSSAEINFNPLVKEIQNTNTISERNLDLSQLVSRESDSSLLGSHQENYGGEKMLDSFENVSRESDSSLLEGHQDKMSQDIHSLQLTVIDSSPEDGIFISFSPKDERVKSTHNESHNNLGSLNAEQNCNILQNSHSRNHNHNESVVAPLGNNSTVSEVQLPNLSHTTVASKLDSAEQKLQVLKNDIMNFIGTKTSDVYNQLDEKLVQIMMTVDCLKFDKSDPLEARRENIVQDIYKYSILLERKHLDHEFLDDFEQEISLVESEMRQSLRNQKLENLQHIASDVADMIIEIENKIVDHLLIERRENCLKRLQSVKGKLNIFLN